MLLAGSAHRSSLTLLGMRLPSSLEVVGLAVPVNGTLGTGEQGVGESVIKSFSFRVDDVEPARRRSAILDTP
ncbi:hypothetical protein GFS60_06966 (plasmid) [Rhodococcus sp. WAY2]|nr:hypothetical protein GFS60_06966 [Rhodococcus sp. WAY2]